MLKALGDKIIVVAIAQGVRRQLERESEVVQPMGDSAINWDFEFAEPKPLQQVTRLLGPDPSQRIGEKLGCLSLSAGVIAEPNAFEAFPNLLPTLALHKGKIGGDFSADD